MEVGQVRRLVEFYQCREAFNTYRSRPRAVTRLIKHNKVLLSMFGNSESSDNSCKNKEPRNVHLDNREVILKSNAQKIRKNSKESLVRKCDVSGSSSSSRKSSNASESEQHSGRIKHSVEKPLKSGARKDKISPDGSLASKHSAGVQTDTGFGMLETGGDIVRLLNNIAQALASERRIRSSQAAGVLSLDRKSRSSQNVSSSQSSRNMSERSSIPNAVENTNTGVRNMARAASTPIPVKKTNDVDEDDASCDTVVLQDSDPSRTGAWLVIDQVESKIIPPSDTLGSSRSEYEAKEKREIVNVSVQPTPITKPELADQGTQISARSGQVTSRPCAVCQNVSCHCQETRMRTDQSTQMSNRGCACQKKGCLCHSASDRSVKITQCGDCKSNPCICSLNLPLKSSERNFCDKCKKADCCCLESSARREHVCLQCKMSTCVCKERTGRSAYEQPPVSSSSCKIIHGRVFKTYVDADFSSSQTVSSGSDIRDGPNKENAQCSVCKCAVNDSQKCVFCCCHLDKKLHIPQCTCHKGSPRYVLAGFCKCHKRNLRSFDKCKCRDNDVVKDGQCPCCLYFTSRMRANLIAAQLEGIKHHEQKAPPPPPQEYFLKLEETEVSKDSTDVSELERRPLDVVTIKIPVKRMGRAKVLSRQFYYGGKAEHSGTKDNDVEYFEDIVRKYKNMESVGSEPPVSSRTSRNESNRLHSDSRTATSRRSGTTYRTLQECLESNRPDFVSSAEYRRRVIVERARERDLRQQVNVRPAPHPSIQAPSRIFTTAEIREQTRKKCKKLAEVTSKKEDRRRMENYRTNRLNAEIFAKRLQIKALRGQLDISNSCNLLAT